MQRNTKDSRFQYGILFAYVAMSGIDFERWTLVVQGPIKSALFVFIYLFD